LEKEGSVGSDSGAKLSG